MLFFCGVYIQTFLKTKSDRLENKRFIFGVCGEFCVSQSIKNDFSDFNKKSETNGYHFTSLIFDVSLLEMQNLDMVGQVIFKKNNFDYTTITTHTLDFNN